MRSSLKIIYLPNHSLQVIMRIKTTDNGNIAVYNLKDVSSHGNPDNRTWLTANSIESNLRENTTDYSQVTNYNTVYNSQRNSESFENYSTVRGTGVDSKAITPSVELVCNRQYRINSRHVKTVPSCKSETENLENTTATARAPYEGFLSKYDSLMV